MKTRAFLTVFLLSGLLFAGCHYGSYDDYRDYGSINDSSYREGYRDGRAAERRRTDTRYGRYYDRDYWRYR
jgi:hypothetical protein